MLRFTYTARKIIDYCMRGTRSVIDQLAYHKPVQDGRKYQSGRKPPEVIETEVIMNEAEHTHNNPLHAATQRMQRTDRARNYAIAGVYRDRDSLALSPPAERSILTRIER